MHHVLLPALGGLLLLLLAFRAGRFLGWRRAACWGGHGGMHGPVYGCGGPSACWHHPGARRGRGGLSDDQLARAAGEALKRRLRVTIDQQDIVDHALKDAHSALRELKAGWKDSGQGIAEALRGDEVDEAALAAAFARQDAELTRARQDIASALKQVHAVLDDSQRARLAAMLTEGPIRWA